MQHKCISYSSFSIFFGKRLTRLKKRRGRTAQKIQESEISSGEGGSGLTQKQREKELTELTASIDETTGLFKGSVKGIEESAADLAKAKTASEASIERMEIEKDQAMEGHSPYGGFSISEKDS